MVEVKLEDIPEGVQTYYDKGMSALQRDNLDYAMDMFEAALDIEPNLLHVRKLLRTAAVRKNKTQPSSKLDRARSLGKLIRANSLLRKAPLKALEIAERLLRIDPFNLRFAKTQIQAAEAANLPEAAILTLETINTNTPPNLQVLEPLARLYRETGQFDLEYECRKIIAKLKPNDSLATKELKDSAARLTIGKAGWEEADSFREIMREPSDQPPSSPSNPLDQEKTKKHQGME
jgi:tetratricopeptide (TPR) repeat protein